MVHVVEKITTLGCAKTIAIEIKIGSKRSDKSGQSIKSEAPNETPVTPEKVQRKRKAEASQDKAIRRLEH